MSGVNQTATTTVYVNNEAAKKALIEIDDQLIKIKKSRQEAFEKGDLTAFDKLDKDVKKLEASGEKLKKKFFDVNGVLKDLSGASMRDLQTALSRANTELNKMRRDDPGWEAQRKKVEALGKAVDDAAKAAKRGTENTGFFGKAWAGVKDLLPTIGLASLVGGLVSLGKQIFEVRAEFQKYEAVLKNTLGSEDLARQSMNMLQEVSAKLPISLKEATESFIKLANRGMNPTQEEMIKLTDVAMSQGKSLDMFVEAMLDAQTGEFERLKEFGVRAKSEGDKVTFTFKGQTQTVQKTDEAIKNYLLSLGELPGVAGSSAAVMDTLQGKASNLGDAWDRMLNNMGNSSQNFFTKAIGWITDFVDAVGMSFLSLEQIKKKALDDQDLKNLKNAQSEIESMANSMIKKGTDAYQAQKRARELYVSSMQISIDAEKERNASLTGDQKRHSDERLSMMQRELDNVNLFFANKAKAEANSHKVSQEDNEKAQQIAIKALETNLKRQQIALADSYLKKQIDTNTYNAKLYDLEDTYLQARLVLFRQFGMDTSDIEKQIMNRRVSAQQEINEAIKKAEEDAAKVKQEAEVNGETSLQEMLKDLREQYADEEKKQIQEETDADVERLAQKRQMWDNLVDEVDRYAQAELEITKGLQDIQLNNIEIKYGKELKLLEDKHKKGLISDEAYNKQKITLENKQAEEEKKVKKKYALIDFLMQTGQIIASTAAAVAKSVEKSPLTFGLPWSAINAAIGAVQLGVAYTQYNKVKQLHSGGYTDGSLSDYTPTGVVHANEFVANASAVRNPTVKPVLDVIDMAQRTGTIKTINLPAAVSAAGFNRGYQEGGYTPQGDQANQNINNAMLQYLSDNRQLMAALLAILPNLKTKIVMDEFKTAESEYDAMQNDKRRA